MLKPWSRIHFLCASIKLEQFSSPFSTMLKIHIIIYNICSVWNAYHWSRTRLVSGQAQQALQLGFFATGLSAANSEVLAACTVSLTPALPIFVVRGNVWLLIKDKEDLEIRSKFEVRLCSNRTKVIKILECNGSWSW